MSSQTYLLLIVLIVLTIVAIVTRKRRKEIIKRHEERMNEMKELDRLLDDDVIRDTVTN